ncbi:AraC family transcriptional regulator [Crenobacter caeni]|uniref:Helix-turn-helix transcriptional regulator n=1 Tax=Crenobacter caeni TaxID=2705474 RepID=A0A6B2KT18_9NEIS|nr:AraC family transcriptional regulator [Crenobacter caeni]NDV13392.1 helix-turn-helix transcriptional regulator [Crenobacter caeni]
MKYAFHPENEVVFFYKSQQRPGHGHFHSCTELVIPHEHPIQGRLELNDSFITYPGEVLLIPSGVRHRLYSDAPQATWTSLKVNIQRLHMMFAQTPYSADLDAFYRSAGEGRILLKEAAADIGTICNAVDNEFTLDNFSRIIHIVRKIAACTPDGDQNHTLKRKRTREFDLCAELNEMVEADPALNLGIEELAERFHMSRSTFHRLFKKHFNQPYHQWLVGKRINMACMRLRHSDESIQGISDALGFSSPSHFTRAFRAHFKQTPSQYREQAA